MTDATGADRRLELVRARFADLHYRVLRHLDLGGRRADLHRADTPDRPWVKPLTRAYRQCSRPMLVQVLPLAMLGAGEQALDPTSAVSWLRTATGDESLAEAFRTAYAALDETHLEPPYASAHRRDRAKRTLEHIADDLVRLRQKLWARVGEDPGRLRLVDLPSLETSGGWTRGRATTAEGERLVGVSLHVPPERALVQILHEEVHRLTDPAVGTAAGVETIEEVAVEVGEAVIEATLPALAETYRRWRRRFEAHDAR